MSTAAEFSQLLDSELPPARELGVSLTSIAKVTVDDKLAFLRNRNSLGRGEIIYAPFGGAISLSTTQTIGLRQRLDGRLKWRKPAVNYKVNLRFVTEPRFVPEVVDWAARLPERARSPIQKIKDELAEEGVLELPELSRMTAQHMGYCTELIRQTRSPQKSLTFVISDIWSTKASNKVLAKLERAAQGPEPKILLAPPEAVPELVEAGRIATNALGMLSFSDTIEYPDHVMHH